MKCLLFGIRRLGNFESEAVAARPRERASALCNESSNLPVTPKREMRKKCGFDRQPVLFLERLVRPVEMDFKLI